MVARLVTLVRDPLGPLPSRTQASGRRPVTDAPSAPGLPRLGVPEPYARAPREGNDRVVPVAYGPMVG